VADELLRLRDVAGRGDRAARDALLRHLEAAARDGDAATEARIAAHLGWAAMAVGRPEEAVERFARAGRAAARAADREAEADAILEKGVAYLALGDLLWVDRALDECGAPPTPHLAQSADWLRAHVAYRRGDLDRAERLLHLHPEPHPDLRGRFDQLEGLIRLRRGDDPGAEAAFQAALAHQSANSGRVSTLLNLADIARAAGRLDDAAALLDEAEPQTMFDSSRVALHLNRALLARDRGDPAGALAALRAVRSHPGLRTRPRHRYEGFALGAGLAAETGRLAESAEGVQLAWATRAYATDDPDLRAALSTAADALARAGHASEAARAAVLAGATLSGPTVVPLDALDLLRPLAAGGMGEVWEGRHPPTGSRVAVKLVTRTGSDADALREEIRRVATLDHPNVVPLLDTGVVDAAVERRSEGRLPAGTPWYAMPLFTGGALDAWGRRLSWRELRPLLRGLLAGLGHAHAHGVVHLDVKPSNVLLRGSPALGAEGVALADFGIATTVAGDRRSTGGTPAYLAPEQRLRGGDLGPWTDLYGVAGVAWALLAGRAPRAAGEPVGALPPLPPELGVHPAVAEWIAWLGGGDPRARPRFAGEADAGLLALPETETGLVPAPRGPAPVPGATVTFDALDGDDAAVGDGGAPAPDLPLPPLPARPPAPALHLPHPGLGIFALRYRRPALVGRDAEVQAGWDALRAVAAGGAATVRWAGPSGVGRTAVLETLVALARAHGFVALTGSGRTAAPLAVTGAPGLARVVRAVRAGDERAAVTSIAALATQRPVLVAFDDADLEPSLRRWAELLGDLPGVCVAVVSAAPLAGERLVELAPLADPEMRRLVELLVRADPELAGRLVAGARGFPGYVVGRLARWSEEGLLWSGPDGVALAATVTAEEGEPVELTELVAGLPGARRALTVLALLGVTRDDAWARAGAAAGVPLDPRLVDRVRRAGLDRALTPRLAEVLLADADAGGELAPLAAAAVGALGPGPEAAERRAELLELAGDADGAGRARLVAVNHALGRGDLGHAAALLARCEDRPGSAPPEELAWLRSQLELLRGRPEVALSTVRAAAARSTRLAHQEGRALAMLGRVDEAEAVLRAALAAADGTELGGRVGHSLALARGLPGVTDEGLALLRRAAAVLPGARLDLARVLRFRGLLPEARAELAAGEEQAPPGMRGRFALQRGLLALAAGDRAEAEARFRGVLGLVPPRSPEWNVAATWLAELADVAGRSAEALALVLPLLGQPGPGPLAIAVAATATEPAGRCDEWIRRLADERRDETTSQVVARALRRAESGALPKRVAALRALLGER
jgi:tetratricopeptide (TPR) repeat protein